MGVILSYLSIFITVIIALIYTPIMIRLLGQSEYGLYSLIGSAVGYLSILDMGLGNAIVRFTARNRALGNKDAEAKLNGMFLALYTCIGVLTIIIGMILYCNIDNMFEGSLTSLEIKKAKIMVILLIINFSISFPLGVFSSIMQAYERFTAAKIASLIRSIMIPCFTLPLLLLGYGSVSMVVISTVINILCLLFNVYYCFKYLKIKFFFGKFDRVILMEITSYSLFIFLNAIVDKVYWSSDQFILGVFSGTVPVAIYAIAMQFINLYMLFSTSISGMFLPKVSIMVANKASNIELTKVMVKFGRWQYVVMAYISSGFILFGKDFIELWAGNNYSQAFYITILIMIPLTIPLIQNIGISILQAKNLHAFRSVVLIFISILKILVSISLAKNLGGIGGALSTGVSLIVGNVIIMNIYYHYKIGLNMLYFWRNILFMSLPVILSTTLGFFINYFFPQSSILIISVKIFIYTIFYFMLLWLIGFNSYEKDTFTSLLKRILKVITILYSKMNIIEKLLKLSK